MGFLSPESAADTRAEPLAWVHFLERILGSVRFWWVISLACAGILAFSGRHSMNPDGLSYLDLASEASHGGPAELVNGLWSPGYPALLGLTLALLHPSPAQEFPLMHFVNFLIFVATLWAFQFFLRHWLSYADTFRPTGDQEKRAVVAFAFCTFLWFMLEYVGLANVAPDLAMAAIVFLAAGITCRLCLPDSGRRYYVALGLALGVGYYAKAPMLPLGLVLLGALFLYPPGRHVDRRRLLLSLAVFLLVAAPLTMLLSKRAGYLSFGEAGRLNYGWWVNGLQAWGGWTGSDQGQPISSIAIYGLMPPAASTGDSSHLDGIPEHPPRRLMERPLILEFGTPVKGTFPLWYDPAYWYAGAKVRFDPHQQVAAIKGTLPEYKRIFSQTAAYFGGAIVLWILAARQARFSDFLRESWLWTWPLVALLMYALVHVEARYVAVFCVLLWVAIYGALMARVNRQTALAVCATVAVTTMIPFTTHIAAATARDARDLLRSTQPDYQIVGARLRNLGLRSGDRLAIVGYPFDPYYAHYAGLRVAAEIPATDEFWNLTPLELESVASRLKEIGVKAVVAENRPASLSPANWQDVSVSEAERFSILLLSDLPPKDRPR
jgi:hypothetical protein